MRFLPYEDDDDMLTAVLAQGVPQFRVSRPTERRIVLGRGSDPEKELHLDECIADEIPIYRRRGGGCSVLLDPGNLILSAVIPLPGLTGIRWAIDNLTDWAIRTLSSAGIGGVHHEGTSDLAIGDMKIGGSCIYRAKDLLYYSTTLLVNPDRDAVERYVKHPPREPEYRAGRTHRVFMGAVGGEEEVLRGALQRSAPPLPGSPHGHPAD